MTRLFEVNDPRGLTVVLLQSIWRDKIVGTRPWMANGWIDRVERAVVRPTYGIYGDSHHKKRACYYLRIEGKDRYLKVVVEFGARYGSVISAYPCDSMKPEERLIWPESKG